MLIPMAAAGLKSNAAGSQLSTATSWWHAGDITGSTLNDQITTNDLTIVGSPTVDNDGTHNRIVLTYSPSDYLDGGNVFNNDGATDMTIVLAWTYTSTQASTQVIVGKRSSSDNGYNFRCSSTDVLSMASDGGATPVVHDGPDITSEIGSKVGTGFGFSGGTGANQFIYHNAGTRTTETADDGDYSDAAAPFRVGVAGNDANEANLYFYGMAVWMGTALTDGQIDTAVTELFAAAEV